MIGPLLIIIGLYWMWALFHGKAGAMWNAITGNSGFSASLNQIANYVNPAIASSNANPNRNPVTGNASDSGVHMGIDSSGNIITIDKPYSAMTPAEKDAANNYAHSIGNVG